LRGRKGSEPKRGRCNSAREMCWDSIHGTSFHALSKVVNTELVNLLVTSEAFIEEISSLILSLKIIYSD
jgi:hypothetical protein